MKKSPAREIKTGRQASPRSASRRDYVAGRHRGSKGGIPLVEADVQRATWTDSDLLQVART